jgi:hypothetical protein
VITALRIFMGQGFLRYYAGSARRVAWRMGLQQLGFARLTAGCAQDCIPRIQTTTRRA